MTGWSNAVENSSLAGNTVGRDTRNTEVRPHICGDHGIGNHDRRDHDGVCGGEVVHTVWCDLEAAGSIVLASSVERLNVDGGESPEADVL